MQRGATSSVDTATKGASHAVDFCGNGGPGTTLFCFVQNSGVNSTLSHVAVADHSSSLHQSLQAGEEHSTTWTTVSFTPSTENDSFVSASCWSRGTKKSSAAFLADSLGCGDDLAPRLSSWANTMTVEVEMAIRNQITSGGTTFSHECCGLELRTLVDGCPSDFSSPICSSSYAPSPARVLGHMPADKSCSAMRFASVDATISVLPHEEGHAA
ncbi:uncharacterized protein LOC142581958 [Dermacentor variabilis]|uniref:uncharacterized protein LOC142581958 n=1 Tax=Dermacentor variabilis TaxID=34621 RepID=UPI003F5C4743